MTQNKYDNLREYLTSNCVSKYRQNNLVQLFVNLHKRLDSTTSHNDIMATKKVKVFDHEVTLGKPRRSAKPTANDGLANVYC